MSTLHHNTSYFLKFATCELLNLLLLIINFSLTNKFLNGKFSSYGWDCLNYYRLSRDEQKFAPNPFCSTFPTEVSCDLPNVGAAGGKQNHNGMCILSQNIINQKIYLAIWFWYAFLFIIASIHLTFRICTMFLPRVQSYILEVRCYTRKKKEMKLTIHQIMEKCYIGDWFLLHQLSKNVNAHFFRAFLEELKHQISSPKKKSLVM